VQIRGLRSQLAKGGPASSHVAQCKVGQIVHGRPSFLVSRPPGRPANGASSERICALMLRRRPPGFKKKGADKELSRATVALLVAARFNELRRTRNEARN